MISPEIDWWIKNTTEVKNPVYNKKRYAISGLSTIGFNTIKTYINQDENVKLVLCTDFIISNNTSSVETITNLTTGEIVFSGWLFQDIKSISNFNYLIDGERINFQINDLNAIVSMGYITISSRT